MVPEMLASAAEEQNGTGVFYQGRWVDPRKERWLGYKLFHVACLKVGECDPQYPVLRYVCDRLGLNVEERLWLAFLFSLCYCAPNAFFMFTEFPEYAKTSVRDLALWWRENKSRTLFQTDRTYVKNRDWVVPAFASYKKLVGPSQEERWRSFIVQGNRVATYRKAFQYFTNLRYFGRFALFLLLEAVHYLTGYPAEPDVIPLEDAESSRNGLCYAMGLDHWVRKSVPRAGWRILYEGAERAYRELKGEWPEVPHNLWNIESTLCAWKKAFWQTRYFGYYIDRQLKEIYTLQERAPKVPWHLFWEARRACFPAHMLGELNGWTGPRREMLSVFVKTGRFGAGREIYLPYRYSMYEAIGKEVIPWG